MYIKKSFNENFHDKLDIFFNIPNLFHDMKVK